MMSVKDVFKKAVSEISARRDYVRGDKGLLEDKYRQLKNKQPNGKTGKIARIAGLTGIDLSWFLFCLMKYTAKDLNTILLDNKIIDKFKEQNENKKIKSSDSKFKKFFKNLQKSNPRIAATLKLWMLYGLFALMTVGGGKAVQNISKNQKNVKNNYENVVEDTDKEEQESLTYGDFLDKMSPITSWLIAELIATEGVKTNDEGLHIPYQDDNGVWTIGFGSTVLKDGSKVTADTPPITTQEAYELARWHLEEKETFFQLYCYGAYNPDLLPKSTGEAFGLSSLMYNLSTKFIEDKSDSNHKNRFETLRKEYKKYGENLSDSIVKEVFEKYPITTKNSFGRAWIDSHKVDDMVKAIGLYMKDGSGMHWRRWLEAGLISKDIVPEDLLECPVNGLPDFYFYMGGYMEYTPKTGESKETIEAKRLALKKLALWEETKDGWVPKKGSYQAFKEWLKNPKTKEKGTGKEGVITRPKVKDFLPVEIQQKCTKGRCQIGNFSNHKSNKMVFNVGIKDIKNKQQNKSIVCSKNNDYIA